MEISQLNNQLQSSQLAVESAKNNKLKDTVNQVLNEQDDAKLKQACQDLESVFINELMKAMRQTIPKDSLLGQSFGNDVFQSMLDQEYAKTVAKTQTTGLAKMIYDQLKFNMAVSKSTQNTDDTTASSDTSALTE